MSLMSLIRRQPYLHEPEFHRPYITSVPLYKIVAMTSKVSETKGIKTKKIRSPNLLQREINSKKKIWLCFQYSEVKKLE